MTRVSLAVFCGAGVEAVPCEDRAGGFQAEAMATAWIIDGATGVSDQPSIPGAKTDAAWFADELSFWLEQHLKKSSQMRSLGKRLSDAVNSVAEAYDSLMYNREVDAALIPTASVVVLQATFKESAWTLDVVRLGDCVCIIRDKQATKILSSTLSTDFDREFDLIGSTHMERSLSRPDTQLREALTRRRRTANAADGYQIVSAKKDTGLAASEISLQIIPPAAFLIVSDGMFRIVERYAAYSAEGLLEAVQSSGIESVYRQLRAIEAGDPSCVRYPRVKAHDDASAVLGTIE